MLGAGNKVFRTRGVSHESSLGLIVPLARESDRTRWSLLPKATKGHGQQQVRLGEGGRLVSESAISSAIQTIPSAGMNIGPSLGIDALETEPRTWTGS